MWKHRGLSLRDVSLGSRWLVHAYSRCWPSKGGSCCWGPLNLVKPDLEYTKNSRWTQTWSNTIIHTSAHIGVVFLSFLGYSWVPHADSTRVQLHSASTSTPVHPVKEITPTHFKEALIYIITHPRTCNLTQLNTYCLFNVPLEYNNRMLGKLSLLLNFSSIRLIYSKDPLNKQWVLSNVINSRPLNYSLIWGSRLHTWHELLPFTGGFVWQSKSLDCRKAIHILILHWYCIQDNKYIIIIIIIH